MKQGLGSDLTGHGTYSNFTGLKKRGQRKKRISSKKDVQQLSVFLVSLPGPRREKNENKYTISSTWNSSVPVATFFRSQKKTGKISTTNRYFYLTQ